MVTVTADNMSMKYISIDVVNATEYRRNIERYQRELHQLQHGENQKYSAEEREFFIDQARTNLHSNLIALSQLVFDAMDYGPMPVAIEDQLTS